MIWHIFRKDWSLMWRKMLIAYGLLICVSIANAKRGPFGTGWPGAWETAGVVVVVVAGLFLIADLAQLDLPDGAGQDWIARPVRRMDMLLAKLLFLSLAVIPVGLIEVTQNLVNGFAPGRSLGGACIDMLSILASIGLPVLAFASLFSKLTEMIAATFIVLLSQMMTSFLLQDGFSFPLTGATTASAISWVTDTGQSWVYFAGALIILAIQYVRRRTVRSRWIAVAVLVITTFAPLLPWEDAFALEQRLSPKPGAGAGVNMFFSPSSGQAFVPMEAVCIPIAVSGVASGFWVNIDSVKASVLDGDKTVWSHRIAGAIEASTTMWGQMRGPQEGTKESRSCQPIDVPRNELAAFEDRPMRVQLDYSLTLFGPDKSYVMPAVGGDRRMPGLGWCRTRGSNPLEIGCISDNGRACFQAWTTNASASTAWYCRPDYNAIRDVDPDPWGGILRLNVHQGETLVLRTYQPLDHFERMVTTPEIKLHDWVTAGQ